MSILDRQEAVAGVEDDIDLAACVGAEEEEVVAGFDFDGSHAAWSPKDGRGIDAPGEKDTR